MKKHILLITLITVAFSTAVQAMEPSSREKENDLKKFLKVQWIESNIQLPAGQGVLWHTIGFYPGPFQTLFMNARDRARYLKIKLNVERRIFADALLDYITYRRFGTQLGDPSYAQDRAMCQAEYSISISGLIDTLFRS